MPKTPTDECNHLLIISTFLWNRSPILISDLLAVNNGGVNNFSCNLLAYPLSYLYERRADRVVKKDRLKGREENR